MDYKGSQVKYGQFMLFSTQEEIVEYLEQAITQGKNLTWVQEHLEENADNRRLKRQSARSKVKVGKWGYGTEDLKPKQGYKW